MENKRRNKNKVISTTALLAIVVSTLIIGGSMPAIAKPQPAFTIWGTATLDGVTLTAADTDKYVSLTVAGYEFANYTMGSKPEQGDYYMLAVKMDDDGGAAGALPRDISTIYIIGIAINEGTQTIGAYGGYMHLDISASTVEYEPPVIHNLQPPDGSFVNDSTPAISADYYDMPLGTASGINVSSVVMKVDGVPVVDAVATLTNVTYTPTEPMTEDLHTVVNVSVADNCGNSNSTEWSFTVDVTSPVVNITSPADGFATNSASMLITGTVTTTPDDPITTIDVNGVPVDVIDDAFTTTVALTEGANTITATAIDRAENVGTDSVSGMFDTVAPEVAYVAATPSEIVANGTHETELLVGARDLASGIDTVTVDLTAIGGSATQVLTYTREAYGYSLYNCTTTATVVGEFSLPVNVTDLAKNSNTEKNITLTTTAPPTYPISLYTGWNLISMPKSPTNTSLLKVMSPVDGNWSSVWAYNTTDVHWYRHDIYAPMSWMNDLKTMDAGVGYWINMTANDTLSVTGATPPTSITLSDEWNLVGYNSLVSQNTTDAMSSVEGKWSSVWAYNTTEVHWYRHDIYAPMSWMNDLKTMDAGVGYWINMTSADTWTI